MFIQLACICNPIPVVGIAVNCSRPLIVLVNRANPDYRTLLWRDTNEVDVSTNWL